MAKNNSKMVDAITPMDEDFAKWYTDIVKKAELIEYTSVKGCMVIRPYGYAIWENIQKILDGMFKATGHENVCMPMFIPESLLQKEKDHVEGFAPEVAWVTHGGNEKLEERLCVRPTSETLFCEHYANIIHSYRDLPKLYNQWVSVVRWEKTTRPFLRSREFLWQEGHTIHATAEEAIEETERMLNIYADFCENYLAMPVIKGRKTDSDKFAGAETTYAIEALMHDGKALQAGTSHYFGDGFARAFDIEYTDRENKRVFPHQTSWGVTTRLIGAIIMTHGDDNGLVLPPAVAPVQAVIVPVAMHKEGVLEKAGELYDKLFESGIRVKIDDSENSPGWKFAEYEMKGVPVRIEIGPKDIENNQCVIVTRHNREKSMVSLENNYETLVKTVNDKLTEVRDSIYKKALENREKRTYSCISMDEITKALEENGDGFVKAMWCGDEACEDMV
ncbi:proline--tRNA ligase, partial [Porcipelethomonas sp.]|uniref:proline--tRNA ligase n=1 Tax=Porcipelethomonas sp. TaxID=2981675 RepID=UPI003EF7353A